MGVTATIVPTIRLSGRRVLVIEDESIVVMLIQDMLTEIGCEVVGFASRLDDALEKARSLSFDVAILDVNLDGHRTFEIAAVLAKRGLGFVFATGYGATSLPACWHQRPMLQKPFEQQDLERALRVALN
jgi:CheY-like chemotaxis protein